jgi:hypothetical protein
MAMPDYPCDEDGEYDLLDDGEDVNTFGLEEEDDNETDQ